MRLRRRGTRADEPPTVPLRAGAPRLLGLPVSVVRTTLHGMEEWRPVVNFEGQYEVSSLGRLRSLDRSVPSGWGTRLVKGMMMTARTSEGYARVWLGGGVKRVHPLVAEAFIGPRPPGMYVCHNNGDGTDNRVENLRYDTPAGNNRDTVRHGNHAQARKTHCKNGHPFNEENTYSRYPRRCRICRTEGMRKARARYREKQAQ